VISELDAVRGASGKFSEWGLVPSEENFSRGNEARRQLWNYFQTNEQKKTRSYDLVFFFE